MAFNALFERNESMNLYISLKLHIYDVLFISINLVFGWLGPYKTN